MIKLTPEQAEQLTQHPDGVECQADGSERTFVIVDAVIMRRMRAALYQKDVHASVSEGIADMEAGRIMTAADAEKRVHAECEFPLYSE